MVNGKCERGQPILIGADELAAMLSLSTRTVRRHDSAGKIPRPLHVGGAVRWAYQECCDWISHGCPDRSTWEAIKKGAL